MCLEEVKRQQTLSAVKQCASEHTTKFYGENLKDSKSMINIIIHNTYLLFTLHLNIVRMYSRCILISFYGTFLTYVCWVSDL